MNNQTLKISKNLTKLIWITLVIKKEILMLTMMKRKKNFLTILMA